MEIIYDKLVRDKIPEIIRQHGKTPVIRKVEDQDELARLLVAKLREEVDEYCDSSNAVELADILEVIRALSAVVHDMTLSDVERIRAGKEADRGGFKEGLVLEKVLDNK